jgi:hypothetical protein
MSLATRQADTARLDFVRAVDLALAAADLDAINAQAGRITVQGERLPEPALKMGICSCARARRWC